VRERIGVTYFQRRPRAVGNFSVEFIFEDVRRRLGDQIAARVSVGRFVSAGLLRRLYLCLEAAFRQGEVNHVTGDINFVGLFLSPRRTVQTVLDCDYLARTGGLRQAVLRLFWLALPIRRCAYVTAISEATKRVILQHAPRCPPDKIVVIPVAISEDFRRKERPFNRARPRVVQIGTAPNKNVPRLIEALRGLGCELDLIGGHSAEYEALLKASGTPYRYRWGLSREEMLRAYEESDIVALVSTNEGFGMPILEGQAVGRPVITANLLSMPEVAGEGACLVDPFDVAGIRAGLTRIIDDEAYRTGLVARGLENVRRFQPETIARAYLELYRRVLREA
jgi:glycosyltransferase involved in cell wall biosynthesis